MAKRKNKNTLNQERFAKDYKEVTDIDFTDRKNIKKSVALHRAAQRRRAEQKKIVATSVEEFINKGGKITVLPPAEGDFKPVIKSKTYMAVEADSKSTHSAREELLAEEEG